MTVGKNPHRPEGKKRHGDDARHNRNILSDDLPRSAQQSYKENLRELQERESGPDAYPAEMETGGSRPGTESRVKDAIERREAREQSEERGS